MDLTVNGQSYADWASIPPELREKIAAGQPDTDGSGVPDALEGEGRADVTVEGDTVSVASSRTSSTSTSSSSVTVAGQDVKGWFGRLLGR